MSNINLPLDTASIEVSIEELTPEVLENYTFIDTRRPDVAASEPITLLENQNIPGRQLMNDHGFMEKDKGYIFSCYHGNDSRYLALFFRQHGYANCFSLQQGYEAIRNKQ